MTYYLILTVSTMSLVLLAWLLWLKTRSVAFPLGIAMIYYWSLHGGWAIVTDNLGGNSGHSYQHICDRLFIVQLDQYYLSALTLYGAFAVVTAATALFCVKPNRALRVRRLAQIRISHRWILLVVIFAGAASFWIVHSSVSSAIQSGISVYILTRMPGEIGQLYSLHKVLNRIVLLLVAIGLATLASGRDARYVVGDRQSTALLGYVLVLGAMFSFLLVMGNKNELFQALLCGCLFYLANARRPRRLLLAAAGMVAFSGIAMVDFIRGLPIGSLWQNMTWKTLASSLVWITTDNECFAAHFSLYGVLSFRCPITHGTSIMNLLASVVPRVFWPDRPLGIYSYYADQVLAREGAGYTIHHAAGWYLNFGVAGVIAGAVLLGWVWAKLYNGSQRYSAARSVWISLFLVMAFPLFSGTIQNLMRAGPEGYKALILVSILIPVTALAPGCRKLSLRRSIAVRGAAATASGRGRLCPRPRAGRFRKTYQQPAWLHLARLSRERRIGPGGA